MYSLPVCGAFAVAVLGVIGLIVYLGKLPFARVLVVLPVPTQPFEVQHVRHTVVDGQQLGNMPGYHAVHPHLGVRHPTNHPPWQRIPVCGGELHAGKRAVLVDESHHRLCLEPGQGVRGPHVLLVVQLRVASVSVGGVGFSGAIKRVFREVLRKGLGLLGLGVVRVQSYVVAWDVHCIVLIRCCFYCNGCHDTNDYKARLQTRDQYQS